MLMATSLRMIRREWRAGELRLIIVSLIIALACLMSVSLLAQSIANAMGLQSSTMLGGNLVVISPKKIPSAWLEQAKKQDLKSALSINFLSVLSINDHLQLASIKAVSQQYPLLGNLQTSRKLYGKGAITSLLPKPGSIWLSSRLFVGLKIMPGSRVTLGSSRLTAKKVLIDDPAKAGAFFDFSPKAIMRLDDVAKTGIISPGSRIEYRWYLTGEKAQLAAMQSWLKSRLALSQRLLNPEKNRATLQNAFDRVDLVLKLSILIALLLMGLAITMAVRRFLQREQNTMALLRCFGMSPKQVLLTYLIMLFVLSVGAIIIGLLLGLVLQGFLDVLFRPYLSLPSIGAIVNVALRSFGIGLLLIFCVALPWLWQIRAVAPKHLLQKQQVKFKSNTAFVWLVAAAILALGFFWVVPNVRLMAYFFGGLIVGVLALLFITAIFWFSIRFFKRRVGVGYRYGLLNIIRHRWHAFSQIAAFTLTFTVLLLILLISQGVISGWKTKLRRNTPNYFVFNLRSNQIKSLASVLSKYKITLPNIYPMVRGRLFAINNVPVMKAIPEAAKSNNALHRELNLTWTNQLPTDNHLVAGQWWSNNVSDKAIVSVERGLAKSLGLKLGDQLSFRIGSSTVKGVVKSFRTVNWASFHPNFYVIFPKGGLNNFPATYVTSFFASNQKADLLINLVKQFPNITIIDIGSILRQVRQILGQLSYLIIYLTSFILLAGILLLYACLLSTLELRIQETRVLHLLGAGPRVIRQGIIAEFGGIGLICAVIAIGLSQLIVYFLAKYLTIIEYHWVWLPNIAVFLASSVGIALLAMFGLRKLVVSR